jgi:hypothetical protein
MTKKIKRSPADIEAWRKNAFTFLSKHLKPGKTVYTVRTNQTRSGGAEHAVLMVVGNKAINISGSVTDLLDWPWADNDAVPHTSAFDIVQQISYALHGKNSVGVKGEHGPAKPTPKCYKAGYSLIHQPL